METPKNTVLENERAQLIPLTMDHLPDLTTIGIANPMLTQYSPFLIGSESLIKEFINKRLAENAEGKTIPYVIYDKVKQAYAGSTSYANISLPNSRLEIGATWIAPEFQGTGLNTNMKYLMLEHAFESLKVLRVELKTDVRNLQSRRAMEKLGAKAEGILRSHTLLMDGHRRDTMYYSILVSEWPEVKEKLQPKL